MCVVLFAFVREAAICDVPRSINLPSCTSCGEPAPILMLSNLFATKPPLDEESADWIFQVFSWALRHFDSGYFHDRTILVNPTNEHFPGRADSVPAMAELIFRATAQYAGMSHWPLHLMAPGALMPTTAPKVQLPQPLRVAGDSATAIPQAGETIPIGYDPATIGNPEVLIAGLAQNLAHYLGSAAGEISPGGLQNWPQATEVLAVFMGFGLMFANTAFSFQARSCGSCGGPSVQRQAFLSQYDITYALALFCVLKDIPNREVLRHLKKSLRPYFRRCVKDIDARQGDLARCKELIAH